MSGRRRDAAASRRRNLADAVSAFEAIAERQLETLPESDRALERTYLLGSAAASGLAERAFAFEIEHGGEVIERLLEHELEGAFHIQGGERRSVGATPRQGGSHRSDGRRHDPYRRLQAGEGAEAIESPAVAGLWRLRAAGARGAPSAVVDAGPRRLRRVPREECVCRRSATRPSWTKRSRRGNSGCSAAVDGIERGEFPPDPDEPFLCTRCGYASVCRKDYVGDE